VAAVTGFIAEHGGNLLELMTTGISTASSPACRRHNDFCDGLCNACLEVLARWGPSALDAADFNVDGAVGIVDFLQLLGNWRTCP